MLTEAIAGFSDYKAFTYGSDHLSSIDKSTLVTKRVRHHYLSKGYGGIVQPKIARYEHPGVEAQGNDHG